MLVSLVVLMYALWSSVFSIGKLALQYSPPLFLTGFRMCVAGLLLVGYLAFLKRASLKTTQKQLISIVLLGVFSIYLTNILEFWALQYLPSAKACFIYSLSPFFTAFFSYLHFGEKMNGKKWIGLSIGFLGILPVLLQKTPLEDLWAGVLSLPTLAMIGAALSAVYGWILLRLIVKNQDGSAVLANGYSMLIGGGLAFLHSLLVEQWTPLPVHVSQFLPFAGWSLAVIFVSNIVCYNLYGMLLKKFTATFLSFLGLLSPIFASLHGWLFLNEPFSWLILFSTGVVSIGLWIVYAEEIKQGYIVKQPKNLSSGVIL